MARNRSLSGKNAEKKPKLSRNAHSKEMKSFIVEASRKEAAYMTEFRPTFYPHRFNGDGSYDSICPRCFTSVAKVRVIAELAEYERNHICGDPVRDKPASSERKNQSSASKQWAA